jgi:5-methylcytosine-specific restriction endonuclease McrA
VWRFRICIAGAHCRPPNLTLDHVLSRCRGGRTTWENVVAACKPCNHRKNDRTPAEAHMRLLRRPFRPRYLAVMLYNVPPVWNKYLGQRV